MSITSMWKELSAGAKFGLAAGSVAILALVGGAAYWVLRSDYEPVMRSASPEKVAAAVREVERLKVPYRVSADGASVEVPRAELGRVRVSLAGGGAGALGGVGFELFNNTDFSTTEFTQKINYQRALQGELARTISSIDGVASARVHLVLPESGFLRRQTVRPTAAVTLVMEGGAQLTPSQVQGVQKVVAASVPDIKINDIAVLDQDGVALTRTKSGVDDSASNGRLEIKREVDSYMEGKLRRLLTSMDPSGEFSISVDVSLNLNEVKITTEDVLPAEGGSGSRSTGVLVRERQSQRQDGVSAAADAASPASGPTSGSTTREVEYKVGHRIEQVATAPGGIDRISVAVIARASNADVQNIKNLVSHAIGADEERGDSVAVVVFPLAHTASSVTETPTLPFSAPSVSSDALAKKSEQEHLGSPVVRALAWVMGFAMLVLLAWVALRRNRQNPAEKPASAAEIDQIVDRVNGWLDEGTPHGAN